MEKKQLEQFMKNNCKETNRAEFRVEWVIKRKGDKLYVKWKSYNNWFNIWINKKIQLDKMSHFPEPYTHSKTK